MKRLTHIITLILSLGLSALAPVQAQEAASTTTLADLKLGNVILNGPLTPADLKGKVVAVEQWGIN
jgi:hypothetical protein